MKKSTKYYLVDFFKNWFKNYFTESVATVTVGNANVSIARVSTQTNVESVNVASVATSVGVQDVKRIVEANKANRNVDFFI